MLARTAAGPNGWTQLVEHDAKKRAAWTFPASKGKRAFCLREDVVWEVRNWVRDNATGDKWRRALTAKIEDGAVIGELQLPVPYQKADDVTGTTKSILYRREKNVAGVTAEGKEPSP